MVRFSAPAHYEYSCLDFVQGHTPVGFRWYKGMTLLIVTHDIGFAYARADRVLEAVLD